MRSGPAAANRQGTDTITSRQSNANQAAALDAFAADLVSFSLQVRDLPDSAAMAVETVLVHVEMHGCPSGTFMHTLRCPCGGAVLTFCESCNQSIVMLVGQPLCEHAVEALEAEGLDPPKPAVIDLQSFRPRPSEIIDLKLPGPVC